MTELHLPWLGLAVLIPLLGASRVVFLRDADRARKWSVATTTLTLFCTAGAWLDFIAARASQADDRFHLLSRLVGRELFVLDELSAPLLSLVALLYFLTAVSTLRTKVRRFNFAWNLLAEAFILAAFCSREPWAVVGLLSVGTVFPYLELRARGKSTRLYLLHMLLYVGGMVVGQSFVDHEGGRQIQTLWAVAPLCMAVLVRSGIAPFHCWVPDLFEKATFGSALLFVAPITGAYAAVRLVLPIAPDWVLHGMGVLSLATAVYAAGMSLIQRDARRFFCYLFLSHSALVLVGLEMLNPIGLTGALCIWISIGMAMGGFGLTLRAIESRCGRLSLTDYLGLYEHTPNLATCFVLTGLASVGFPGTFGFVGTELLVDGAVATYPYFGMAVVIAAALNGIAIVQTFFRLFTGTRYVSSVSLLIRVRERYAVLSLAGLIFVGGLMPQPWVASRHHAAEAILVRRGTISPHSESHATLASSTEDAGNR